MEREMSTRTTLLLIAVCATLGVLTASPTWADDPKPPVKEDTNIKDLQKERLTTLKEMARLVRERLRSVQGTMEEIRNAERMVLDAELDLCATDKERVEVLEKHLVEAKNIEKMADQLYKAGQMRTDSALLAKAERLQVEIALARVKAKLAEQPPKGNTSQDWNEQSALAEKQVAIKQAGVAVAEVQKKFAIASLSSVKNQYTEAQAAERYAEQQMKRVEQLATANAVSMEMVDELRAKCEAAKARKAATAGMVNQAEAQIMLEEARMEVARKKVEEAELRWKLLKQRAEK
jgi:hypothetical protein